VLRSEEVNSEQIEDVRFSEMGIVAIPILSGLHTTTSGYDFRKGQGSVNYNWNWGIFFQTSPDGVHTYLETLLLGTGWTLATALSAWCLALAMGTLVGVIRTTPNPWLVRLGTAYVELFRNVPLLVVQIFNRARAR
jgi:ABC-type amino acid transport system permease subunit